MRRALISLAVMLTAHLASPPAIAQIRQANCTQIAPGQYRIEFELAQSGQPVEVSVSANPDGSEAKAVGTAKQSPYEIQAGHTDQRLYFVLKTSAGDARVVAARRLPLQGAANVRDLGGYKTEDGRYVRWGRLYRAGELGHLTPADVTYLRQLRVKVLCDFRTEQERSRSPDLWPETPEAARVWNPVGTETQGGTSSLASFQQAMAHDPKPAELHELMVSAYRSFAIDGAPEYRNAMQEVLHGPLPFLYHCTAGKDRTGLFSAVLLLTLGVPRGVVMDDYLLSNEYLLTPEAIAQTTRSLHTAMPDAPALSAEATKVILGVDASYLEAALGSIDKRYGSFAAYRRQALGVSDVDVEMLRQRLLTQ